MKNILESLYYGEVCPCRDRFQESKVYREAVAERNRIEAEMHSLFQGCKQHLDDYTDIMQKIATIESERDFEKGFRLGAKFTIETLYPKD